MAEESKKEPLEPLPDQWVDELEDEILSFWEYEKDRTGLEISLGESASFWIDRYFDTWVAKKKRSVLPEEERRRHKRIPYNGLATVRIVWSPKPSLADRDESVLVKDISGGGLYFYSELEVPERTLLEIRLTLPESDTEMSVLAVVVRVAIEDDHPSCGVCFSFIEPEFRKKINEHILKTIMKDAPLLEKI